MTKLFSSHSVGHMLHDVLASLDRAVFEVHVLCLCCNQHSESSQHPRGEHALPIDALQTSLSRASHLVWTWLGQSPDSSPPSLIDQEQCTQQLATRPALFLETASSIAALQLDVLVYPDLGVDKQVLSFARQRLAANQAVFMGHAISQEIKQIDYHLSSELFQVHNPRCQFPRLHEEKCPFQVTSSEQVVLLGDLPMIPTPPLGSFVNGATADGDGHGHGDEKANPYSSLFDSLALPAGTIDRMDKHVYLLPHPVMVYSTVFIKAIAALLLKDPIGFVVILYKPLERLWFEKLRRSVHYHVKKLDCHTNKVDRATAMLLHFPEMQSYLTQRDCVVTPWQGICKLCCECSDVTHMHSVSRRLVLLPFAPDRSSLDPKTITYSQYVAHSSVVLDSFPVGMDVTSALEVLAAGRPIVTLPSYQTTPSAVLGLVRALGVNSSWLVAPSTSEYVSKAVHVAHRSAGRDALVVALREGTAGLFSEERRASVVQEWEVWLEKTASGSREV